MQNNNFCYILCVRILSEEAKMLFDLYLGSSETSEQTSKRKLTLGLKTGLPSAKL